MPDHSEGPYFLKELFPAAGPDLQRLLQGAVDNAFLLRTDFYTIRDWLEIAHYEHEEVLHAILLLMLIAIEEGSLCVELSTAALLRRLRDFVPEDDALSWAERIGQSLDMHRFSGLIGTTADDRKPVIVYTAGARRFLYFQKYLRAEDTLHAELTKRIQQPSSSSSMSWSSIVEAVLRTQELQLDHDQRLALSTALVNNLAIISGGPGTGKTSIVLTLLRCLIRGGYDTNRIALAAPTGRAAQRLTDALGAGLGRLPTSDDVASPDARLRGMSATTLHQLLGYRPTRNVFSRHAENLVPADVVIIDEVSMVGVVLMSQLLQALGPRTKLILLGDKDQLPSVEAGAVLANLVREGAGPKAQTINDLANPGQAPQQSDSPTLLENCIVLLQTNHRSQQEIRDTARAINGQDVSIVDRLPTLNFSHSAAAENRWTNIEQQGGCWLLEQTLGSAHELRGFLQNWANLLLSHSQVEGINLAKMIDNVELGDSVEIDVAAQARFERLFAMLNSYRLLTLVRESPWGCDEINQYLSQILRPRLMPNSRTELFAGAPVLITRNDTTRGLYNGDVGITLRHRRGGLHVLFQRHDKYVSFPAESLPAHALGFALTVHKSQGSEYAHIMLVLPPTGAKRLLTKELIYTAITRAKSLAVICSTKEALKSAIGRRIVRESGLLSY